MKNIITILIVFFSSFLAAQETQFTRNYSQVISINSAGVKSEWKQMDTRFIYNYSNNSQKIKAYIGNIVKTYTQISETIYDKTNDGTEYAAVELIDDENGEELLLQLFKDGKFGVRLLFLDESLVQFVP